MPFAVAATILLFWFFRTLRWFVLLKASDIHINFFLLYVLLAMSVALALITPFQSGEAVKVELLKKTVPVERVPGYGIFFAERILDLLVVLLIAAFGMIFGLSRFPDRTLTLALLLAVLIALAVLLAVVKRIPPSTVIGRLFQPLKDCIRDGRVLAAAVVLTICGWLSIALGWYASLRSVSIYLGFFETIVMTTTTTLIILFSLIPWGLGISEVGISSFLVYFNQDVPLAQAGALIIRGYALVALGIGIGFFGLWQFILKPQAKMPVDLFRR